VKRFRSGLVFKAHRLLYHSTLGLRVIKKEKKGTCVLIEVASIFLAATSLASFAERQRERARQGDREIERRRNRGTARRRNRETAR